MDASVVVKWILSGEPYEGNATALKEHSLSGRTKLCAPSFMVEEVANSLWKAIKRNRILQEDAQETLQTLNDLKIELVEVDWVHASEVLGIACKLDLTVYDAAYLFLANQAETRLITADDKLYEKAKGHFQVLHVKDY